MINLPRLQNELTAASLAIVGVALEPATRAVQENSTWYGRAEGQVRVDWLSAPTGPQNSAAASVVAAHDGTPGADDILQGLSISKKCLLATMLVATMPANQVPSWATQCLDKMKARVTSLLNGKTPSGNE